MGPTRDPDALTDEALVAGMAVGDPAAATAFVRRYQRRVYGLALSLVGDPGVADDIAQQAFERAWRHASAFDGRRALVATWLLTITRNLAIDELRRRRVEAIDPAVLLSLEALDPTEGPEGQAVLDDDVQTVRAHLRKLPAEQRRAVLLAAWHGRTAAEIAQLEGIPLGTAKTRVRDGLRRLRSSLTIVGPEGEGRP